MYDKIKKEKRDNMKELNLKKCMKCNTLIRVLEECNCDDGNLMCCGEKMQSVVLKLLCHMLWKKNIILNIFL